MPAALRLFYQGTRSTYGVGVILKAVVLHNFCTGKFGE